MINAQPTTIIQSFKPFSSSDISSFQTALHVSLQSTFTTFRNAIPETDSNRNDKRKAKHRRTPFVVIADSHASFDLVNTPKVDAH